MKIYLQSLKLIIAGISAGLLLILFSAPVHAPGDPLSSSPNASHGGSLRSASQQDTQSPNVTQAHVGPKKKQHIFRFQDELAKQKFLTSNNLEPSDLTYIEALGVYSVRAQNIIASSGVKTFINQRYSAFLTPTDPLVTNQWHFTNTNTLPAWNHQSGSSNVTVAVIDTGFGLQVTDIANKWAENTEEIGATTNEGAAPNCTSRSLSLDKRCNNIDDDNDGYTDNYLGWNFSDDTNNVSAGQTAPSASGAYHGTTVSSLIAAQTNNSAGGSGMSWGAKILPIQALDDYGDGYTISVALSIRYAVDQGADIINMSLGAEADDPLVSEQIDYATENGVVVVAASGNDGCNCISYPARYPDVIAVGATNSNNSLASFSNYGSNLDLVAPGAGLCSTVWTNAAQTGLNACGLNGTSFSSPLVAGAAALLLSQNPTLTPAQISASLTGTATKLSVMNNANFTNLYGYGHLNTFTALNDVSTTSSIGSPLSASRISLAELDTELVDYEYDKFNSTCSSLLVDVVCTIRAINTQTNQTIIIATGLAPNGTRSLQQDILTANLTAGTWIMQAYLTTTTGIQSMAREKTIIITD